MRTLPTFLVLALLVPMAPALAEQPPERLTFDDLFDDEHTGRRPAREAWRPDGGALTYVWDAGEGAGSGAGQALWSLDPATGETTLLVSAADLPSLDSERDDGEGGEGDEGDEGGSEDGVRWPGAYHWSPTGAGMVIESGGDLLWLPIAPDADSGAGAAVRLTDTEAAEEAPAISPDGRRLAYVREADLYVLALPVEGADGGGAPAEERRMTTDGEPGRIYNATTDWVYWEEIWGRDATAFWWSPDSSSIAYYRFDDSEVGEYVLLPSYDDPYPEPRRQRYPKSGTTNPEVTLGVMDVASGETTWLDLTLEGASEGDSGQETYIARVHWVDGHGGGDGRGDIPPRVAVERLNREQTELDLVLCDGGGDCRVILEERHPTWINLGNETRFLSGDRLIWASERDGWRHLYLYRLSDDGPARLLRALTEGSWAVTSIDHAGDDGRLLATAYGTGPLGAARRRLISIDASTEEGAQGGAEAGAVRELTGATGWHQGLASPDGRYVLHGWSSAADPGWERVEPVGTEGGLGRATAELPSVPPAYDPESLPSWRYFEMPAGEGSEGPLPAAMLLPAGVSAPDASAAGGGKHPVIMYHYGGPGSQVVADRWPFRGRGLWHQMMAQRGYGVLTVDNRASVFFGKAGEDRVHRRFGEVNLEAQRAGVRYLESLPWADASRVGLWGWSGGGSNTLYCMLESPGTWRAGMSGAPVTDWRYYDTIWTERYLDHPDDNPDGYRDSSAVTHAEKLADRLLIVHGTADDNVHPQNSMALAKVWTEAGIPFEMAIYPGETHGFRDAASRHFFERMTEFFERTLAADR